MTTRLHHSFLLLFLIVNTSSSQVVTISGTVRDGMTQTSLPSANVRVVGTSKGTVSNAVGVYRLSLEQGDYTIITSFIGYHSDTLRVSLDRSIEYNPRLQPTAIEMAEVVITSEDPAMAIMRKVIEYKKRWSETLKSYEFDAFTRMAMRRETSIAMIMESYTTGYWQKGDTLREVVKQKRRTENIPGFGNLAVGGSVVNFYDDDVFFVGYRFVGPTSPEAFDYYDFKLEKTRTRDDKPVYTIRISPKSHIAPLFRGKIDVIGDTYALVGVDIAPNEAFTIPFVSGLDIRYSQQFGLYESRYWMPMDIRLTGGFEISLAGFSFPKIVVEQASVLYDYRINKVLADSIFRMKRITELPTAKTFDSLFWAQHDVLPLTHEEQHAYKTLDSTQTLDKQFKPSGPLADLTGPAFGFLSYINIRYNRAEGLFLGGQYSRDSLFVSSLMLSGSAGYGFSDKKAKFSFGASVFLDAARRWKIGAEGYEGIAHIPDAGYYPSFAIALASVLNKRDYRDYYYVKGWRAFAESKPLRRLSLVLECKNEDESTAFKTTDFSLFQKNEPFRPNPPIQDGTMRSLDFRVRYGDDPVPFGLVVTNSAEVELEHSNRDLLASSFDFTRAVFRGEARINTYSARLLFPPTLNLKLSAGIETGSVPPQRIFSLESRYDGIGPLGVLRGGGVKEFSGQRFVAFTIEHNFRSTPFLILNIPYLYRNSIEVTLYGTAAKTWTSEALPFGVTTNGWYTEAGIGISRILTLFRFDFTYRFAQPRGLFVSVGVAQLI
ncbi:MAG: DUF5686 family protein [Ignavibacteriales bacterium]|nr:DUF5686 family protein [Ignavibacteriales bacterium]